MTFKVILSSLVLRLSFMYVLSLCGKTKTSEIIGRLAAIKRELKQPRRRRRRQQERQNAIDLFSKTTTLHVHHTFFVHFFALTARL